MNFIKRMFGAKAQYIMMVDDTRVSSKRLGVQSIILAIVGLCVVTVGVVACCIGGGIQFSNIHFHRCDFVLLHSVGSLFELLAQQKRSCYASLIFLVASRGAIP